MTRAAFLDRDGVIVEDVGHLCRAGDLRLLPGAGAAIRALREAGWRIIVVTNQSVVARGLCTEDELAAIHTRLRELLRAEGADWDDLLYCPHHPTAGLGPYRRDCACRKPKPGMLLEAARRHGIDLAASFLVGDQESDLEAAREAGCEAILARAAAARPAPRSAGAGAVVTDLAAAAQMILAGPRRRENDEPRP
jgi:D-glycero-D-manno-heptose 1,7-bisphosphate phosphatase